jgi:hypothetical protein
MINLRYHIVSIVAVFLALAVGVVMGSTVISDSELDFLQTRQQNLERENQNVLERNAQLRRENDALTEFQQEAEGPLLAGDLSGVVVTVIGVKGIDREPAEILRAQLANAGAQSQGTIWLTRKLRLDSQADIESLAGALGVAPSTAEDTRAAAIAALAQFAAGTSATTSPVPALNDAGFVEVEAPPDGSAVTTTTTGPLGVAPSAAPVRAVVMSGAGAEMSDDEVAIPLVRALAGIITGVVAAEAGNDEAGGREVFVGPFRRDAELAPGVSTVDNVEAFAGRAAVVVLLRDPAIAQPGHYGVGPQASREIPPPAAQS